MDVSAELGTRVKATHPEQQAWQRWSLRPGQHQPSVQGLSHSRLFSTDKIIFSADQPDLGKHLDCGVAGGKRSIPLSPQ